jgi:excisionase family DNA binding protein
MAAAAQTELEEQATSSPLAPLLTPQQVSEYLHVPLGTLANWRYQGRGPAFVRFGRHVRYRAADVTAWIDGHLPG